MTNDGLQKLRINLFGEGEVLIRLNLGAEEYKQFESAAQVFGLPFPEVLCDPFFYYRLRHPRIQSAADLNQEMIYRGLSDTAKNQLEVWFAGRKVIKVKMAELTNEMVLFPLYNVRAVGHFQLLEGIYIKQKEVGLIASYETQANRFDIDSLQFNIVRNLLYGVEYKNATIKFKKSDTLIVGTTIFQV